MTKLIIAEEEIGTLSGQIWHYLNKNGETDVIKIKHDLNCTNHKLYLALGWLARENKILITRNNVEIKIALK